MIFLNQLNTSKSERNTIIPFETNIEKISVDGYQNLGGTKPNPLNCTRGSACVYDNKMYVFRERNCYYMDASYTWTKSSLPNPYDVESSCAIVYKNEIHLIGCHTYSSKSHYVLRNGSWVKLNDTPNEFSNPRGIIYNNELYVVSGEYFYKYNDGDSWTLIHTFDSRQVLTSIPLFLYNNKIYMFAFYSSSGIKYPYYVYDGEAVTKYDSGIGCAFDYGFGYKDNDKFILVYTNGYKMYQYKDGEFSLLPYPTLFNSLGSINFSSFCVFNNNIHVLVDNNIHIEGVTTTTTERKMCIIDEMGINIYSNNGIEVGNDQLIGKQYLYTDTQSSIFVYNKDNTKLLYTNQTIRYNQDTSKYEMYGYFPDTLKNTTVPINSSGWQTLQLDTPNLFK